MNIADSERLAAFLEKQGFSFEQDIKKAGVVIINTCGVRQMAEDRVYGLVNTIKKNNPQTIIVITGCLSRREDVKKRLAGRADIFIPTSEMMQLPKILKGGVLAEKFSLETNRLQQGEKYLSIAPKRNKSFSANVPIGNGCDNFCSYCVVPYARGREVYRPAQEIVKELKNLIKEGYKEITLIAQNVNSYHDKSYNFPKLLKAIIKIPGDFWIRFVSSHPKDMSDELIAVMASSDKICHHVHLAVQSGDDTILKRMNRKYTAQHFEDLIAKLRKAKPGIAITTDVIVGFPGETKKQFENTAKLFKRLKFDLAYIAQYSPRPGTAAAKMKDNIAPTEKKRREEVINDILKETALENNKKYLGQELRVLIEGINKRGKYYGKTSTYQTVLAKTKKANQKLIGTFAKVKISKVLPFALEGDLVDESKAKVLVILGTTAAGKTKLGVNLAAKFNGEIISADSRQVYQGMDIGTGKDLQDYKIANKKIKYHLIDVVSPKTKFDLAQYQKLALQAINDVLKRGKLPIIVGGSGLYLQAIVDNYQLSEAKPDLQVRAALEKFSAAELFAQLTKLKPEFAARLNNSDKNNKRRLIRYLEIIKQEAADLLKKETKQTELKEETSPYSFLLLGIDWPDDILRERIFSRLHDRLEKEGMVQEVERLQAAGVSWERLMSFGLEYKFISQYLLEKIDYETMVEKLGTAIYRFAKRQKTWFKRWQKQGRKITWVTNLKEAEKELINFLS